MKSRIPYLVLVLALLAVIGALVANTETERKTWQANKQALAAQYQAGVTDGIKVGRKAAEQDRAELAMRQPEPLPVPSPSNRGPLDLDKLTPEQVKNLHCYIERKPGAWPVELPPRLPGRGWRSPDLQKP